MARGKLQLRLIRSHIMGNAFMGSLMVRGENGHWNGYCVTLEDLPREQKIKHETCIPAGKYVIKKREVLSEMTKRYRKIYGDDFDYHLMLQDVPNYTNVYIHHGNKAEHSSGCILVGKHQTSKGGNGFITSSRTTFRPFYAMVSAALNGGLEVTIDIIDESTI